MRLGEYPMVLWAKGKRDPVGLILEMNYYLAHQLGEASVPDTCDGEKIELTGPYLQNLIQQWTADDGVFYTRLDAANGLRLSLSLNQPPNLKLPEVLVVSFLKTSILKEASPFHFENLLGLFRFGIRLFEPFWGGIYDDDQAGTNELQSLRLHVDAQMVPLTIDWFNYFGPEMVEHMGGDEKLLAAPVFLAERMPETGGIWLVLQPTPFDFTVEEHRSRQQAVQDYLELDKLHRAYPK